jgi:nucleoside-diphosphate-sugar epimerase
VPGPTSRYRATMHVTIAGGHGKIALRTTALLTGRADHVTSIIRNPDHRADIEHAGGTPIVLDLETTNVDVLAPVLRETDAVVFAAGAGPGSGATRKDTVDRAAAVLLAEAAQAAGVRRYLLISSTGVDDPPRPGTDEVWAAYLTAKKAAEEAIRDSALDWTILRPGRLTDQPGTGRVLLAPPPVEPADVTRDDTAAVLVALLDTPTSAGRILELRAGDTAVLDAVSHYG